MKRFLLGAVAGAAAHWYVRTMRQEWAESAALVREILTPLSTAAYVRAKAAR